MEIMWALLASMLMYLSLIIVLLLANKLLNLTLPSLSPSFKIVALLLAVDLFMLSAFGIVGLGMHFLDPSVPIVSASAVHAYEIVIGASNTLFGLFEIGTRCVTGNSLGEGLREQPSF